jgi:hypothetical protein
MAAISSQILLEELAVTFTELEKQVNVIKAMARASNRPAEKIQDSHGDLVMAPLLIAKAQTLHALVLLEKEKSLAHSKQDGARERAI